MQVDGSERGRIVRFACNQTGPRHFGQTAGTPHRQGRRQALRHVTQAFV